MNHQNGSDFLVFQEVLDPFGEFPEMPRWRVHSHVARWKPGWLVPIDASNHRGQR
jgi:hypothetical protein